MLASPTSAQDLPRARRSVTVVAAATLAGFLVVNLVRGAVQAGEEYAPAAPLRIEAAAQTGVGGLLPPALLGGRRSKLISARDLRPGVVLLVTFPCDCLERLEHIVAQASGSGVRVYLVGFNGRPQIDRLAQEVGRGVVPMLDKPRTLEMVYRPGPESVLLLVRRDGVVSRIFDGVPDDMDLAPLLRPLVKAP